MLRSSRGECGFPLATQLQLCNLTVLTCESWRGSAVFPRGEASPVFPLALLERRPSVPATACRDSMLNVAV